MVTVLDVSNVQGAIDWRHVTAPKIVSGVYCKASEGRTFVDSFFARHRHDAARHGLHVGAYHFARPDNNPPALEAEHFLHTIGGQVDPSELVPVLDLETGNAGPELVEWARAFNRHVHAALGVWPLFYSYPDFIRRLRATRPIGGGLWLASYGRNDGREHPFSIPSPWRRYRLHQFTSRARIAGVNGPVDVSHGATLNGLIVAHRLGGNV